MARAVELPLGDCWYETSNCAGGNSWGGETTCAYSVTDGSDYGQSAWVLLTDSLKNHRPITQSFVERGVEDTVIVVDGFSLKKDLEGDFPVSVTVYSLPKHGVLFLDTDNDNVVDPGEKIAVDHVITWTDATARHLVKFKPDADWNGDTQFLHSVNDPWAQGSHVPARIVVENDHLDGPVAGAFTEVTSPNSVVAIDGWNWTPVQEHSKASIEITSLPDHGTLFADKNMDGVCSPCDLR